ncbi:MAG: ARMT1-like domain-containing protein [Nitrospirota bacterium]
MKADIDCIPCFFKQTVIALREATSDRSVSERVMREIASFVREVDLSENPAVITTVMHRMIRTLIGCDPYSDAKRRSNRAVLMLYPELGRMVSESDDPLLTTVRIAAAGNEIDFGLYSTIDIKGILNEAINGVFAINDYDAFRDALYSSESVMYLTDNAGEIVLDKLLISVIKDKGKHITVGVKGSSVINDATLKDAEETGITDLVAVIANSNDCVGTILEFCSNEFLDAFNSADVIISKGQANFETLSGIESIHLKNNKAIFYIFKVKCDVVAREVGVKKGDMILKGSGVKVTN